MNALNQGSKAPLHIYSVHNEVCSDVWYACIEYIPQEVTSVPKQRTGETIQLFQKRPVQAF